MTVHQGAATLKGSSSVVTLAETPAEFEARMGMSDALIEIRARQQAEKAARRVRYSAYRVIQQG